MAKPRPTLKAAITCDQAIKEAGTNKWTLVGLFNQVLVQVPDAAVAQMKAAFAAQGVAYPGDDKFGIPHPSMGIYFCVSNAEGSYDFELQFVKLDPTEELLVAKLNGKVNAQDRLQTTDLAVNFQNVVFPGFGRYAVKLVMDGSYIGEKSIDVKRVVPGPPKQH